MKPTNGFRRSDPPPRFQTDDLVPLYLAERTPGVRWWIDPEQQPREGDLSMLSLVFPDGTTGRTLARVRDQVVESLPLGYNHFNLVRLWARHGPNFGEHEARELGLFELAARAENGSSMRGAGLYREAYNLF